MIGETRISHFQPNHRWVTSLLPHTIWNTCRFHRVLHNQCRYKYKSMTNNVNSNMYTPYISRQTHTSFSITRPEFCIFFSPAVAVTVDTLHCWQLMAFAYIDGRKESNACGINSIAILLILTETMCLSIQTAEATKLDDSFSAKLEAQQQSENGTTLSFHYTTLVYLWYLVSKITLHSSLFLTNCL